MTSVKSLSYSCWPEVADLWSELAEVSLYTSFFLTTEWIETWLEIFGPILRPEILIFQSGGVVEGACLLVRRKVRRGPIIIDRVYLNAAGEDEADETCLEFNNLLTRAGSEQAVARALREHMRDTRWDEFIAQGFCEGEPSNIFQRIFSDCDLARDVVPSYYVDLEYLRLSGGLYDNILGQPTRKHLRQNLRKFASMGELHATACATTAAALENLDRLADLHQRSWNLRGQPGVFSSPVFTSFHRALIQRTFARGSVQVLRVEAGEQTVGILYNFVYRGKVYFYQSGLSYSDPKLSPGLVTIFYAVQHCLQDPGLKEFDFMAGSAAYKKSLATGQRTLSRMVFRRDSFKLRTLDLLRRAAGS